MSARLHPYRRALNQVKDLQEELAQSQTQGLPQAIFIRRQTRSQARKHRKAILRLLFVRDKIHDISSSLNDGERRQLIELDALLEELSPFILAVVGEATLKNWRNTIGHADRFWWTLKVESLFASTCFALSGLTTLITIAYVGTLISQVGCSWDPQMALTSALSAATIVLIQGTTIFTPPQIIGKRRNLPAKLGLTRNAQSFGILLLSGVILSLARTGLPNYVSYRADEMSGQLVKQNRMKEAIKIQTDVESIAPERQLTYYNLGTDYLTENDLSDAKINFKNSISRGRQDGEFYSQLTTQSRIGLAHVLLCKTYYQQAQLELKEIQDDFVPRFPSNDASANWQLRSLKPGKDGVYIDLSIEFSYLYWRECALSQFFLAKKLKRADYLAAAEVFARRAATLGPDHPLVQALLAQIETAKPKSSNRQIEHARESVIRHYWNQFRRNSTRIEYMPDGWEEEGAEALNG